MIANIPIFTIVIDGFRVGLTAVFRILKNAVYWAHKAIFYTILILSKVSVLITILSLPALMLFDAFSFAKSLNRLLDHGTIKVIQYSAFLLFCIVDFVIIRELVKRFTLKAEEISDRSPGWIDGIVESVISLVSWIILLSVLFYATLLRLKIVQKYLYNIPGWPKNWRVDSIFYGGEYSVSVLMNCTERVIG